MSNLTAFTVAPEKDSVRTAFFQGQRLSDAPLSLEKSMASHPEYALKQYGVRVALIRGKELVCGGDHFAVIPILPRNWEEQGNYVLSNANVPYWDGEQRLRSLGDLLYALSRGLTITEALDDAVTLQDDLDMLDQEQPEEPDDEAEARAHCEPEQPQEYLWTIWYEGRSGGIQRADLTCTREMAGKVWDVLAGEMTRMLSARP